MKVTLLGSGEAVGVPAPLCECRYCDESPTRRRPGLLVESEQATVVLDVSPDIKDQLHATNTTNVDAFFVTHNHFDHVGGMNELHHAAMTFDEHVGIEGGYLDSETFTDSEKPDDPTFAVYFSERGLDIFESSSAHLVDSLELRTMEHGESVEVGDIRVVPFPVRHARPAFDTLGFAVYHEGAKVVYAPDMWEFADDKEHEGADVLFAEGAALFRTFGHGAESDLRSALRSADADQTVLLNLNEHLQRMTTDELRDALGEMDVDGELGEDFATYRL
ncbi:Phosphoribosyl 1,2-cyclic phosphodiesterase [Halopelagius longus]|uniref:Phosphoribosyl 1,2-cyclic phosphodiesterase n=1 Tax=Halopelagius longus TaxID=1236180 RepID=A0A1H0ZEN3_9EURY|nr:Phosphoribosyl 1,2-cyclic phosphodiesterase [Halopelagius longus]